MREVAAARGSSSNATRRTGRRAGHLTMNTSRPRTWPVHACPKVHVHVQVSLPTLVFHVECGIHSTDAHTGTPRPCSARRSSWASPSPSASTAFASRPPTSSGRRDGRREAGASMPQDTGNDALNREHRDDPLRLVATIKLKENTASDIFRRPIPCSRQHALYQTLKSFGQIVFLRRAVRFGFQARRSFRALSCTCVRQKKPHTIAKQSPWDRIPASPVTRYGSGLDQGSCQKRRLQTPRPARRARPSRRESGQGGHGGPIQVCLRTAPPQMSASH
ncbi:MAG: Tn3 family transposase [Boseongicola sp. SB0677_bin_26]|nr:Tn3 family transposase [Boseongicola sp. SB0665_bin_10]MYG25596.1 Tn3 family transposase [Boseongicola sp. SB0677_bin_26]